MADDAHPPQSFWLPDNLRPPRIRVFWRRYLVMGILMLAWAAVITLNDSLWFRWDAGDATVRTFGVVWRWTGQRGTGPEAVAGYESFVNGVLRAAIGVISLVYVVVAACAYGWGKLREHLAATPWLKVAGYALAGAAVFILGDCAFERVGAYSGDPLLQRKPSLDLFLISLAAIGIVGPVAEEIAVRFTLFQFLRTKLVFPWAALISSAIFGLMHFGYPDAMKMVMCLAGGWVLSWSYERTGSVLAPIGVHVLNNCFMQVIRIL